MARRWREHMSGKAGARYFRGRRPQELCYLEINHTRSSASQREASIKLMRADAKRSLIAQHRTQTLAHIDSYQLQDLEQPVSAEGQC